MSAVQHACTREGKLATAISGMVVQALREHTGRGPTRSRTYFNDDLICVVLQDTLSRPERKLVADGQIDLVLRTHRAFKEIMESELVAGVEALTGRKVIAFLCDNSIEPDVKVKSFLLAPEVQARVATVR
jgi:uncharacterized protein YbcI